jgi:hypothetical protein
MRSYGTPLHTPPFAFYQQGVPLEHLKSFDLVFIKYYLSVIGQTG